MTVGGFRARFMCTETLCNNGSNTVSRIWTSTFHHTKFQQRQNVLFLPRSRHITRIYERGQCILECWVHLIYVRVSCCTNKFPNEKKRAEMTTLFETDICIAVTRNRSCKAMPHTFCKESGMQQTFESGGTMHYMMSTSNLAPVHENYKVHFMSFVSHFE